MRALREVLPNPPVFAATIEILVSSLTRPFSLVPGHLASDLGASFPNVVETDFAQMVGVVDFPLSAGLLPTHVLRSGSGKREVRLGLHGVAVCVFDYVDSSDLERCFTPVFQTYLEIAGHVPIFRLGLRYENRFDGMEGLTARAIWPELPSGEIASSTSRMTVRHLDPAGEMAIVVGEGPAPFAVLDMDFSSSPQRPLDAAAIVEWFGRAHDRVWEAFTAFVKPDVVGRQSWQ